MLLNLNQLRIIVEVVVVVAMVVFQHWIGSPLNM